MESRSRSRFNRRLNQHNRREANIQRPQRCSGKLIHTYACIDWTSTAKEASMYRRRSAQAPRDACPGLFGVRAPDWWAPDHKGAPIHSNPSETTQNVRREGGSPGGRQARTDHPFVAARQGRHNQRSHRSHGLAATFRTRSNQRAAAQAAWSCRERNAGPGARPRLSPAEGRRCPMSGSDLDFSDLDMKGLRQRWLTAFGNRPRPERAATCWNLVSAGTARAGSSADSTVRHENESPN